MMAQTMSWVDTKYTARVMSSWLSRIHDALPQEHHATLVQQEKNRYSRVAVESRRRCGSHGSLPQNLSDFFQQHSIESTRPGWKNCAE